MVHRRSRLNGPFGHGKGPWWHGTKFQGAPRKSVRIRLARSFPEEETRGGALPLSLAAGAVTRARVRRAQCKQTLHALPITIVLHEPETPYGLCSLFPDNWLVFLDARTQLAPSCFLMKHENIRELSVCQHLFERAAVYCCRSTIFNLVNKLWRERNPTNRSCRELSRVA